MKIEKSKTLVVPMDPEVHRQLKIVAVRQGRSMSAIVREAVRAVIALDKMQGLET